MNIRRWLDQLHSLFAPKSYSCLTCGKPINKVSAYQRHMPYHAQFQRLQHASNRKASFLQGDSNPLIDLCHACFQGIPWIRSVRCPICGRAAGCMDCMRRPRELTYFVQNRSAVQYNAAMREWLAEYKYRGNERYATILGNMLTFAYVQLVKDTYDANSGKDSFDCITYVPVSDARLMERGFNQAERMAVVLSELTGISAIPLLKRSRHTGKQSFKSRGDRIEDMKEAFALDEQMVFFWLEEWHRRKFASVAYEPERIRVILVDDVYTTGSTVNACAEQLQRIPSTIHRHDLQVNISCLTWARS